VVDSVVEGWEGYEQVEPTGECSIYVWAGADRLAAAEVVGKNSMSAVGP